MNKIDRLFAVRVPCYKCGKVVPVSLEDAITLREDYHTVACSKCPHAADCECDGCFNKKSTASAPDGIIRTEATNDK